MGNLTQLSKFVSLTLRHRAKDFGLEMDSQGFVDFEALRILVGQKNTVAFSDEDWQKVLNGESDGKKRFEVVGGRIRALYGHSRVEQVSYQPVEPPEILYHGTTPKAEKNIRRLGLQPMKRQYVHLSKNLERAQSIGNRRTDTVTILIVRAKEAYRFGIKFYNPESEHFLAKTIPPEFIDFPES